MVMTNGAIEEFAALFDYPDESYLRKVEECRAAVREEDPEIADKLGAFLEAAGGMSLSELQELYIAAFDLNPLCALEIGWHLYGEDYKRGEFLAWMRRMLREHGIPESTELPDHLAHVLRLLSVLKPAEVTSFTTERLSPALDKMVAGFGGSTNPFSHVVKAVQALVGNADSAGSSPWFLKIQHRFDR